MLDIHQIILEDVESVVLDDKIQWNLLSGKSVLVTGASGLIGSYLVFTLLCANEVRNLHITVVALVRNREKAEKQFTSLLQRGDFRLVVQDVTKPLSYGGNINYIIHAASQASPKYFVKDPVGTIKANTIGMINLLEYARLHRIDGVLYLSSREVYGEPVSKDRFTKENEYGIIDPTLVRSCYPESKRMSENLCACYNKQYKVNAHVVRLSHVYGPDYTMDNGRVWGEFIMNVVRGENIVLKSDGMMELAFTYVSDAVSGIFFALLNGEDFVYNISNSDGIVRVKDLAELCAGLYPEKGLMVVYDIKGDIGYLKNKVALLDSKKIMEIGWKTKMELDEGVERCIKYIFDIIGVM